MWYFWFAMSLGAIIICFIVWRYYRTYYDDKSGENFVWSFGPYSKSLANFNLNLNKNKLNRYQRVKNSESNFNQKNVSDRFFVSH